MAGAFVAQIFQHAGRVGELFAVFLAVQNAQGIAAEPLLTGFAQPGELGLQIFLQLFQIGLAAGGAADGIDGQLEVFNAVGLQYVQGQGDDFRVHGSVLCAEHLHAVLVELAQPAGLGLFVAEGGAGDVIHLAGHRFGEEMGLDESPGRAGGAFGLQGDGTAALVVEGVHLLLYHVGGVAHAPLEQLRVFEHGGTNFPVSRQGADAPHGFFNALPAICVCGQHILGALGRLCQHDELLLPNIKNPPALPCVGAKVSRCHPALRKKRVFLRPYRGHTPLPRKLGDVLGRVVRKTLSAGAFLSWAKISRLLFPSQPGVFFIVIIIVHGPRGVKLTFLPGEGLSRQSTFNPVFRRCP